VTLLNPAALALLAIVLPAILLLHARRRRTVVVANAALWRRVAPTAAAVSERRRIPWRDPQLALQLLAATAAIVALAQPTLGARAGVHWIVVIDASLSMGASDVAPTRLDGALALVRARWGETGGPDEVSLVRVGPEAGVVAAAWPTGPVLADALARVAPSDGRPAWDGAVARVRLLDGGSARVVVLTDAYGAAGAREALATAGLAAEVVVLGDALVNVAVVDVAATSQGRGSDRWTVTGGVATTGIDGGETVRIVAGYRPFGGTTFLPWGGADVVLDRDGSGVFTIPLDLPGPGEVELRGPSGDRLPGDDRAVLVLRDEPVRVAVVGPREPALMRALAAVGDLQVFVGDAVPEPAEANAFDLVIVTGDVPGVPATSTLWLGVVPEGVAAGPAIEGPLAGVTVGPHPLARDLDPTSLQIERAVPLRSLEGAVPLLVRDDATLAWARTTTQGRQVVVGFGLSESRWAAQLSFPAFIAAIVAHAAPRAWSHEPAACRVGASCPWPREAFAQGWTLLDPSGRVVLDPPRPLEVSGDPLATAVWDEVSFEAGFAPERAGRYTLGDEGAVVGLPVLATSLGREPEAASAALPSSLPAPRSLLAPAAGLALLLVAADAVLAARRRPVAAARRPWRPLALAMVAIAAWLAALLDLPVPVEGAGGRLVTVASSAGGEGVPAPRWASEHVRVAAFGAPPSPEVQPRLVAPDLAMAIEVALALPPEGPAYRVAVAPGVGQTLEPEAAAALARTAAARGAVIDRTSPPSALVGGGADPAGGAEGTDAPVRIEQLTLPDGVRAGATFALRATLRAAPDVDWRWRAERLPLDGTSVSPIEVEGRGPGLVELPLTAEEPGEATYRLSLFLADEPVPVDTIEVTLPVGPRLSVLAVATDRVQGSLLVAALAAQAIDVRVVTPFRMPATLERLLDYDAIALVNVRASELFTAYQANLEAYVRDQGRGLVVFGGRSAYGPGGYFRTPLEELSPLSAQITDEAPEVTMVFVLDRSGSMNAAVGTATRLDIATVATREALELLGERSLAGIVVFDAEARVLVPLTPASERAVFDRALGTLNAAGGTAIYPGLALAFELLAASESASRHVVVMTDGLSQEGDFEGILAGLTDLGVSTSFVGVGEVDRRQLTRLANLGGGALHMAIDIRALPSILAQEALMLSATAIEERPTRVDRGSPAPFLDGIGAPPPLLGFVKTTAKPDADVHLVERLEGHPLLASWRYGLGRVVAFASEADGPWSDLWTASPEYERLWSQTVRWTAERAVRDAWSLHVSGAGGRLDVVVHHPMDVPADALTRSAVELVDDLGATLARSTLRPDGVGRAVTSFEVDPAASGTWRIRFAAHASLGPLPSLERPLAWPLPPLPPLRGDGVSLEALVRATGGVDGEAREAAPFTIRGRSLPEAWLLVGLVLFLASLALRYGLVGPRRRVSARAGSGVRTPTASPAP
jgi:uncharacterized membrane protein